MKIKHLFLGALALAATVVGCKPQEINGSKLEVNPAVVEAAAEQSDYALTVEADCKWAATTSVEWLAITPAEGTGNATVTVSVLANKGAAREATVHFQKFDTRKVSCDVTVKQASGADIKPGDGTLENPYLASQAAAICAELESEATTPDKVYVKGYVKKFASKHESGIKDFGNALFYITDDAEGTITPDFYCYQVYYLQGNKFTSLDQIKLGDEVVVYGQLTNYNGTYETVGKGAAYCYSINGETEPGVGPEPEPVEAIDATVAEFIAAANPDQYYRLKGEVVAFNSQYTSFDVKDETGSVYVYSVDAASKAKYASEIVNGKIITVVGKYFYYEHATDPSKNKVEIKDAIIEKLEDGEPVGPVETVDATVAEFLAAAVADTPHYRLTGIVGGAINTQYGNFELTDATGTVQVYGLTNIDDVKDKLLKGATITVVGPRADYQGTPEMKNGKCESIEGGEKPEPVAGVFYTLDTSLDANKGKNNGYAAEETTPIVVDGIGWNGMGNLTMAPWRIGGKNLNGEDRAVYTTTGMTQAATKVVFTAGTSSITINSAKLLYGSKADFSDATEVPFTVAVGDSVEIPVDAPAGSYFKFVFNLTETSGSNKYVQFSKVEFVSGEGGDEGEHYTLDQVNAMDCYIYAYGDGRYVCDADLYVADAENNTYSHNLDIYVPLMINEQTKIAGNHTMAIDPDYYEYYGYTTNEGVYSPFTEGTINISYVSQGVDSEGDKVYFYNVVIAAKLQNGQDFNLTVNNCRVYAVDVEDEEWPYIELTDGTKAGMSGKAVKTVKATRQIVKRK